MRAERESGFDTVLGMPTCVIKYGKIELDTTTLFLVIPGNPGVIEYYDCFMSHLHASCKGAVPVWGVSHAGHVQPPGGNQALYNKLSYDLCTLSGQIRHKIAFIKEYIPINVRLFLIGHSIGCYIILKILEQLEQPIARCFMLFPTIERMASSPNGRIYTPMLKYLRWLAPFLVSAAAFLPESTKKSLIQWHFTDKSVPKCVYSATEGLIDSFCVSNALFMANEEMQTVADLDRKLVTKYIKFLSFYYGQSDGWCPLHYSSDFKILFPECDVRVCEKGYSHAYVLGSSRDMADIVAEWSRSFM